MGLVYEADLAAGLGTPRIVMSDLDGGVERVV